MNPVTALLFLAGGMFLVGLNVPLGKIIVADVPVFLFMWLRFLIAAPLLALISLREGPVNGFGATGALKRFPVELGLLSLFGNVLFTIFILYGVSYTSASQAGVITATIPAMVLLMAAVLLRERITRPALLAIALAVGGVALLNLAETGGSASFTGNLLVFGAVVSESVYVVLSRRISTTVSATKIALWTHSLGLIMATPLALSQLPMIAEISAGMWALMLFYIITASIISFIMFVTALPHVPMFVPAVFTSFIPVTAICVGLLMGEEPGLLVWAGLVIVALSLLLTVRSQLKR